MEGELATKDTLIATLQTQIDDLKNANTTLQVNLMNKDADIANLKEEINELRALQNASGSGLSAGEPAIGFYAYVSTKKVFTHADDGLIIVYDTTVANIGNCYDNTTGKFTGTQLKNHSTTIVNDLWNSIL